MGSGIIEPPWRDAAKSDLWTREREIREMVSAGYSSRQIIRILDLKVGGRPVSRTWLSNWIARNGMRTELSSAKNDAGLQNLAEKQDSSQGASTVRQRADSKAERYVSEHAVNPVLSRIRKEPT